jgi:hypothetical protein
MQSARQQCLSSPQSISNLLVPRHLEPGALSTPRGSSIIYWYVLDPAEFLHFDNRPSIAPRSQVVAQLGSLLLGTSAVNKAASTKLPTTASRLYCERRLRDIISLTWLVLSRILQNTLMVDLITARHVA